MSDTPKRIQRKRTKGWKMPDNTVYVGRPSEWGNPFDSNHGTPEQCVHAFKNWLTLQTMVLIEEKLKGKNLACWCKLTEPCHADVLLRIANGGNR